VHHRNRTAVAYPKRGDPVFCLRKEEGDEIMNQKGTTLIELIIVLVVIMVVGAALVLPNVSIWYPMTY